MSAPLLMRCATFLFAAMGVCVKFASDLYGAGEIVVYRGLVGVIGIALVARARRIPLSTTVPDAARCRLRPPPFAFGHLR